MLSSSMPDLNSNRLQKVDHGNFDSLAPFSPMDGPASSDPFTVKPMYPDVQECLDQME